MYLLFTLIPYQNAAAHTSYLNMQATNTTNNSQTINNDGSVSYNVLGRVLSNGAWANAADENWGNSHWIPWYKFEITNPQGAIIDLSVVGGVTSLPASPALTLLADLTPAFTLYRGLVPDHAHDGANQVPGKVGMWQALADTTMGNGIGDVYDANGNFLYNDPGTVSTINYLTHRGTVDGTETTASLNNLFLTPGSYTLTVGGTCYECFPQYERTDPSHPDYDPNYENNIIAIEDDAAIYRGVNMALTVHPVPVPGAIWLMASGLACFYRLNKRATSLMLVA